MKLIYGKFSPFSRKVLIAAHELGLAERLTIEIQVVSPTEPNAAVYAENPLGKIPVLVLEDGQALFDSRVIVAYLDALAGGARLIPAPGGARWQTLRLEAAADGLADAAVLMRFDQLHRPEGDRAPSWIDGQWRKVDQALDWLEAEIDPAAWTIGEIAAVCALDYLDARFADRPWREGRPKLAGLVARAFERPSLKALPAR